MKRKCMYCGKITDKGIDNKAGYFCNEDHFDKYIKSLSREEYIELQHSFCVCSDD